MPPATAEHWWPEVDRRTSVSAVNASGPSRATCGATRATIPIGTSRLNQSKIKTQTAWICRKASKIEWPDSRSVNTMPIPKSTANTSTRTLSFDDNEANILVGMTAKMPTSVAPLISAACRASMANSTSTLSVDRPSNAPMFVIICLVR